MTDFTQLENYFRAEKNESLLFILVGLVAAGFSLYVFFAMRQSFYTGLAIPVLLVALIQIVVGSTVYFRTGKQISETIQQIKTDPVKAKQEEQKRMQIVMKNFTVYKWIEIAFVISGIFLILFFRQKEFLLGIGLGLLIQGAIMLSLDIFAERRGETYIHFIEGIK